VRLDRLLLLLRRRREVLGVVIVSRLAWVLRCRWLPLGGVGILICSLARCVGRILGVRWLTRVLRLLPILSILPILSLLGPVVLGLLAIGRVLVIVALTRLLLIMSAALLVRHDDYSRAPSISYSAPGDFRKRCFAAMKQSCLQAVLESLAQPA
jgi:hypothetical protein